MNNYTEDTLVQQTTADYLEQELGRRVEKFDRWAIGLDPAVGEHVLVGITRRQSIDANAVHGSDAPETAQVEIACFFDDSDIVSR